MGILSSNLFRNIFALVLAAVVGSLVMMLFKVVIYHFFVPASSTGAVDDYESFKAVAQTFPMIVWYLILLGWASGAFVGGYIAARLGRTQNIYSLPLIFGIILLAWAMLDNVILFPGIQPVWISGLGWIFSLVFPLVGARMVLRRYVY